MNCPYCSQPILPQGEKCPSCGMDADGVRRWLDAPPRLRPGFNDLTGGLREKEQRRFLNALGHFRERHGQCDFHWVHMRVPGDVSPRLQAFHYFNHGRLCPVARSGGNNRDALLLTDAARASAALVVGYGIEAFLLPGELEEALAAGENALHAREFGLAAAEVLRAWERVLDGALERLPRAFGLPAPGELEVRLDESLQRLARRRAPEY